MTQGDFVRMGNDEATSEALYLPDAILLARGKILREREQRKAKAEREHSPRDAKESV